MLDANAPAIAWIIWYADGASLSNLEASPDAVPRRDVLCIAAYSGNHGRMIWHATDYYIWEDQFGPGEWVSVDARGLDDYMDRPGATKIRLRGRHVPPDVFWTIYHKADQDPRLPPRSSYDAREVRP